MRFFPPAVEKLVEEFSKLPGIGNKTAQRLAFYILNGSDDYAESFASSIINAKKSVIFCEKCQNLSESSICNICSDEGRDTSVICVVSTPRDVIAFERTREYSGLYHVLHGNISPLSNVGPDEIRIKELLTRMDEGLSEIVLATNPDTEGEATAMYIKRLLSPFSIKVSRLAYGIPVGSNLEYVDEITLMRALEGRTEM